MYQVIVIVIGTMGTVQIDNLLQIILILIKNYYVLVDLRK